MQAMAAAGLARLEGQSTVVGIMWWRGGFEDPGRRIKSLCNIGQKRSEKKRKKRNFTYVPANEAMAAAGLARLEGRGMVEGWGFEDPARGVKSLCNIGQKRNEKKRKEKTYLYLHARE